MLARWWHGTIAALVLIAIAVQIVIAVRVSGSVTGIVYSTVLAAIRQPHGGAGTLVNTIVHYVVPAGMVLGWLWFGPRPRIAGQAWAGTVLGALAFPVLWLVYTLARGAIWPCPGTAPATAAE